MNPGRKPGGKIAGVHIFDNFTGVGGQIHAISRVVNPPPDAVQGAGNRILPSQSVRLAQLQTQLQSFRQNVRTRIGK